MTIGFGHAQEGAVDESEDAAVVPPCCCRCCAANARRCSSTKASIRLHRLRFGSSIGSIGWPVLGESGTRGNGHDSNGAGPGPTPAAAISTSSSYYHRPPHRRGQSWEFPGWGGALCEMDFEASSAAEEGGGSGGVQGQGRGQSGYGALRYTMCDY